MSLILPCRRRAAAVCLMLPLLSAAAAGAKVEFADQFASAWRDAGDAEIRLQSALELAAETAFTATTDKILTGAEPGTSLIFSAESSLSEPWVCTAARDISISNLSLASRCGAGLFCAQGELRLSSITLLIDAQTGTDTALFCGEGGVALSAVTIDLTLDSTEPLDPGLSYTLFETGGVAFTAEDLRAITLTGSGAVPHAELSLADGGRAIRLTLTPEPGSATLSLLTLAALVLRRRRPADRTGRPRRTPKG